MPRRNQLAMEVATYQAPLGPLELVATERGIVSLKFLFGKHGSEESKESLGEEGEQNGKKDVKSRLHLDACIKWLDAYFSGTLLEMDNPPPKPALVLPEKGQFFSSVWTALASTEVGDTVSYKELAGLSGSPLAARAVGQAVKKHSLPILMPCHRVVPSGPSRKRPREGTGGCCAGANTGNYSGGQGPPTKEWLLEHERKMSRKDSH